MSRAAFIGLVLGLEAKMTVIADLADVRTTQIYIDTCVGEATGSKRLNHNMEFMVSNFQHA
ncbi:hypothetical protein BG58_36705 [Caballeronia jiangsuensis]|nr:hypothetical protein BG58_36705 [Caballeronia jiangsuensis]